MRVALLSDIHGNLHALDAVLADLQTHAVDYLLSLGDVAAMGPDPAACIHRLAALGFATVMGNTDWAMLHPQPDSGADERLRRFGEIERWCAAQLGAAERALLAAYAPTVPLMLGPDAPLLAYHGSPRSFDDPIVATTPLETLDNWFAGTTALVYAGGHTHQPFVRRHRGAFVINPGSVGLAYAMDARGDGKRNRPWAEYAVLDVDGGDVSVTLRRVPYDGAAVVATAVARGMPYADWWGRDLLDSGSATPRDL